MKKEVCEKCIYGQRIDSAMACHCNYYHSPIAVTNRTSCSHYMAKELEPYIKIEVLQKIEALRNCSEKPNGSLIRRQDAIEAIATVTMSIHLSNVLCDKLLALPSADRPTGEWINKDGGLANCSICGERWGAWDVMNYCPNCGAVMKGGEDE